MDTIKKEAAKTAAIVLAAGRGSRMNSEIPKQYLSLCGKPVLFYSLQAFEQSMVEETVLVCAPGEEEYCREAVVKRYGITKVKVIVPGGRERYDSVYEGLKAMQEAGRMPDYVLIHDGARPLITPELINEAVRTVWEKKACVVGVPVKDTIWLTGQDSLLKEAPPRAGLWSAQTPQCFFYPAILEAYRLAVAAQDTGLTDDAAVAKKYGGMEVYFLKGSSQNIKITTPEDMAVAETFLNTERPSAMI